MIPIFLCQQCGAESPNAEVCSTGCRTNRVHKDACAPARWMLGGLADCDRGAQKEIVFRAIGIVEELRRLCDSAPLRIREQVLRVASAGVFAHCLATSADKSVAADEVMQAVTSVLVAQGLVIPPKYRNIGFDLAH